MKYTIGTTITFKQIIISSNGKHRKTTIATVRSN